MKKRTPETALLPADKRASIAVDLGAESCRVSLLRWQEGKPEITLVHRWNRTSGIKNWGWEWQPSAVSDPVKDY